jgi:hypothetical protein
MSQTPTGTANNEFTIDSGPEVSHQQGGSFVDKAKAFRAVSNMQGFLVDKESQSSLFDLVAAGESAKLPWKIDPVILFYQNVENGCHAVLLLSGIGALIYSVNALIQ